MKQRIELFRPAGIKAFLSSVFRRGINLGVIIEVGIRLYPTRSALVMDNEEITYRELYRHCYKLACHLRESYTLGKGKRVAIACRNHIEHVYALFATALTGADIFLIHPEMGQEAIEKLTDRLRFDLFIHEEELLVPVQAINISGIHSILAIPDSRNKTLPRAYSGKIVVLTSGSTGLPKTASRKASATAFLSPFISLLKQLKLHQYETLYPATPLYHGFGLAALLVALLLGKRLYLQKRFNATGAAQMIDKYGIEVITVVPSMLNRLLDVPETSLSSIRCILTGGAMLHATLIEKTAVQLKGNYIYNLYGTSEAGFCFMASPDALLYDPQTIGQPLKGVNVRICDNAGNILPTGKTGELCIKCSWSTSKDQWIHTGDLCYKDEQGYYFLMGRVDNMIVSGGENVYPCELENILLKHPAIIEVAVTGVHDPDFGQRLKAFVVSTDPAVEEASLRDWLRNRCARYQMPREIIFLPSLPYLPNGKTDLSALSKE